MTREEKLDRIRYAVYTRPTSVEQADTEWKIVLDLITELLEEERMAALEEIPNDLQLNRDRNSDLGNGDVINGSAFDDVIIGKLSKLTNKEK